ncbi:MAG: beta-N-acetylhexosaminidase [Paramuribaculum sp.]|nr:beta-N-acetylhexosaminidase [Paramuribaculum sp.]
MKKVIIPLILIATSIQAWAGIEHLMPKVKQIKAIESTSFSLNREVTLIDPTHNIALKKTLKENGLTPGKNGAEIRIEIVKEIPGAFNHSVNGYPDEAYSISISSDHILIQALTPMGVTRAAQTIAQLALDTNALTGVEIIDWPSFKVRGFMHDTGRSFLPVEELKREIDILSSFKVNTFHWHLTDYTGWRLEIKAYPQLTEQGITRFPGMYYTQADAKEIQNYAAERGMTVIPEIDMPGHSHPFEIAMGHSMQTPQGTAELKVILDEVCSIFDKTPYIHIGGDEISFPDSYIIDMINHVHSLGKKVIIWNQYNANPAKKVDPAVIPCDMTTNWATSGRLSKGIPNIDMRYNYTNHFDVFADLVGIYKSSIFESQQGSDDIAGTISAAWCDTYTPTPDDIVRQNNFYANVLASAERAWIGGGEQYIEAGGVTLPSSGPEFEDFSDWERRFLYHKNTTMSKASHQIPYVKQSNVRWYITDQIPNNGNASAYLAPEQYIDTDTTPSSFTINGVKYGVNMVTGAGIYLRHIWHPIVKGFYDNPQNNMTAYAWTYVHSPKDQDCGALIEFYTYSRSGNEKAPSAGQWDRRGSRVWLNGNEIPAPKWKQPDATITQDHDTKGLTNENFTARKPVNLHLKKGWNKLFIKLPHVDNGGTARDKWQFTFVLTDTDGVNALDNITYSPTRSLDDTTVK